MQKTPRLVAVYYLDGAASFSCVTQPERDQPIQEFLGATLLPRLKRDHFFYLTVKQLLSNGMHSPELNAAILLSELIDVRGLITTLIVSESLEDTTLLKQELLDQAETLRQAASALDQNERGDQQVALQGSMLEISWHMTCYQSQAPAGDRAQPKAAAIFQRKIRIDWGWQILGSYPIQMLTNISEKELILDAMSMQQNKILDAQLNKQPAYAIVARDCYGGYVFIVAQHLQKTDDVKVVLCLPLIGRFSVQYLQQYSVQEIARCQNCKQVKIVAGVEQTINQAQTQDIKLKSEKSENKQPVCFLLNVDGFCFALEALPSNIAAIQWALDLAYHQSFGEQSKDCGGDKTLFQAILTRAAAVRFAEAVNSRNVESFTPDMHSYMLRYNYPKVIQKFINDLDILPEMMLDPVFASFRSVAMRSDSLRIKILQELFSILIANDASMTESKLHIIFSIYEQFILYPCEILQPQVYADQIDKLKNLYKISQVMFIKEQLATLNQAMEQFAKTKQTVPYPSEFEQCQETTVEEDAVQFGKISVVLLHYHRQSNTVMLKKREDGEIDYIVPNESIDFTPEVFGKQFNTFLNFMPQAMDHMHQFDPQSIFFKFCEAVERLDNSKTDCNVSFVFPDVFTFSKERGISRRTAIAVFAVSYAETEQQMKLNKFLETFSLLYSGESNKANSLLRIQTIKREVSQLQRGTHFILTHFQQDKILVRADSLMPPTVVSDSFDPQIGKQEFKTRLNRDLGFQSGANIVITNDSTFVQICTNSNDFTAPDGYEFRDIDATTVVLFKIYFNDLFDKLIELYCKSVISEFSDFFQGASADEQEEKPKISFQELIANKIQQIQQQPDALKRKLAFRYIMSRISPLYQFYQFQIYSKLKFKQPPGGNLRKNQLVFQKYENIDAQAWIEQSVLLEENNQFFIEDECFDPESGFETREQWDDVEMKNVNKSLFGLITRIQPSEANKIAEKQVQNDQFVQELLAGDKRAFEIQNQEVEDHLLDIIERFEDDDPDLQIVAHDEAVVENSIYACERLSILYKYVLNFALQLEVPRSLSSQQNCLRYLGYAPQLVQKPQQRMVLRSSHFQQAVAQSACHFAKAVALAGELGQALGAVEDLVVEDAGESAQPEALALTKSIGQLFDDLLAQCDPDEEE